jgi:hypothetical protein
LEVTTSTLMGKGKMSSLDRETQTKWSTPRLTLVGTALKANKHRVESSSFLSKGELEVCQFLNKTLLFKSNSISQGQLPA